MSRFANRIRHEVDAEIERARAAEPLGHFDTAFAHLERAHVLGQQATRHHVRVHCLMLAFAVRNRWRAEVAGQLWRVVAAAIFTPMGLLPAGNTGGTSVSGFRPLPVPTDLKRAIDIAH